MDFESAIGLTQNEAGLDDIRKIFIALPQFCPYNNHLMENEEIK
jgi:hypothetical protein